MSFDLRSNNGRDNFTTVAHDGSGSFIAGRFNSENQHMRILATFSGGRETAPIGHSFPDMGILFSALR
jgi:hypothetical protein